MKSIKKLQSVLAVTLATILLVSCGTPSNGAGTSQPSQPTPASESAAASEGGESALATAGGEITYKGSIAMFAQAYQPVEPTDAKPNPPTEFRAVAEEYTALHPDITIDFITSVPGDDYVTWLKTKLSAGMAPDIVWAQNGDLTGGTYPKGAMVDLSGIIAEQPNPYVEGNEKWVDLFHENLITQLYDTNGQLWQINADYVATAVICNMDMFREAGITEMPTTWGEFVAAQQKLQDKGYTPWAFPFGNDATSMDRITWLARLFYTNYYGEDFEKMAVQGSQVALTPAEIAIAFKNGDYDVRDPRYLDYWRFIKEQTEYMPDDYLSATMNDKAILSMFVNQNVAMYFDGSWATNDLKLAKPEFEYAMFPFPVPDASISEYATGINSTNAIGGPSAAFQYAIPSQKANKSLTDEKLAACIDWLMFATTPENDSRIVNELGSFVPTIKGAEALPGSETILESLNERSLMLEGGVQAFGVSYLDAYYRTFQEYMGDKITLEEAAEKLAPLAEQAADKIIAELDYDVSEFIK